MAKKRAFEVEPTYIGGRCDELAVTVREIDVPSSARRYVLGLSADGVPFIQAPDAVLPEGQEGAGHVEPDSVRQVPDGEAVIRVDVPGAGRVEIPPRVTLQIDRTPAGVTLTAHTLQE